MTDKKFECGECGTRFAEALYWFDSLHFANWPIREIILFCGPKCVQKWHDEKVLQIGHTVDQKIIQRVMNGELYKA